MAACRAVQVTQMKYRLSEGSGECFYYIGAPVAAVLSMFCSAHTQCQQPGSRHTLQSWKQQQLQPGCVGSSFM
jgi:hypothetical protein